MKYSGHVHFIYTTADVECDEQEFIVQVLQWHAVCRFYACRFLSTNERKLQQWPAAYVEKKVRPLTNRTINITSAVKADSFARKCCVLQ